jgi:hypothetical protein
MWGFRRRAVEPPAHERVLFNVGDLAGPYARYYNTYNRVVVTADTAGRLSAVWRCLVLLCDVISTLPIHVYRTGTRVPVDPAPPLFTRPAADMPFDEWAWIMLWDALTSPAAWGLIVDRGGAGLRPSQIEPCAAAGSPSRPRITTTGPPPCTASTAARSTRPTCSSSGSVPLPVAWSGSTRSPTPPRRSAPGSPRNASVPSSSPTPRSPPACSPPTRSSPPRTRTT